jgi:methanogenic corrinoid protein MtbC1
VLSDLFWPVHEHIEKLHRADQMTALSYHLSTRLLRMLVDQTAARLSRATTRNTTVFAASGPNQGEELAGQMACDMLEAAGFEVTFAGGGVPPDEVLERVQATKPDILVLFSSSAADLPDIRYIIDRLKEVKACPSTRVVVGGGVFNRAEGLAAEIGANDWAYSPADIVDLLTLEPEAEQPSMRLHVAPAAKAVTKRKMRPAA